MTMDLLDAPSPICLDGDIFPDEVWIWSGDKFAFTVNFGEADWFIATAHDEPTIRFLHGAFAPGLSASGAPEKVTLEFLEKLIVKMRRREVVGYVLMDRDGVVARRYVR